MSLFDANTFLDATTTEALSRRPPLPAGADFVGVIGEFKPPRETPGKKDPSQVYFFMDVPITFDLSSYPEARKIVGVDKVVITDSISLDLKPGPDGATLVLDTSPGKNARLFRYREALGMNVPGQPFNFRSMIGRLIKCKIKHDPYNGEIYDKIDSVAKA